VTGFVAATVIGAPFFNVWSIFVMASNGPTMF
jgi:hypothetical protein